MLADAIDILITIKVYEGLGGHSYHTECVSQLVDHYKAIKKLCEKNGNRPNLSKGGGGPFGQKPKYFRFFHLKISLNMIIQFLALSVNPRLCLYFSPNNSSHLLLTILVPNNEAHDVLTAGLLQLFASLPLSLSLCSLSQSLVCLF